MVRISRNRPGYHPRVAWRWSLESGLSSKGSRVVRGRVVGKVPIGQLAGGLSYGTVRFGGRRLETQVKLCAGRLPYWVCAFR